MKILQRLIGKIANSKYFLYNPYVYFNKPIQQAKRFGLYFPATSKVDGLSLEIRKPTNETHVTIGENSCIQGNFVIESDKGQISIGNDVMFSWGCTVVDNNSHSIKWSEREMDVLDWKKGLDENRIGHYKDWSNVKEDEVIIKDKAWIGFNVTILKGVTIGEGSIVGAGSVVTKDVPDWTIVAGNPSKIIKEIPIEAR